MKTAYFITEGKIPAKTVINSFSDTPPGTDVFCSKDCAEAVSTDLSKKREIGESFREMCEWCGKEIAGEEAPASSPLPTINLNPLKSAMMRDIEKLKKREEITRQTLLSTATTAGLDPRAFETASNTEIAECIQNAFKAAEGQPPQGQTAAEYKAELEQKKKTISQLNAVVEKVQKERNEYRHEIAILTTNYTMNKTEFAELQRKLEFSDAEVDKQKRLTNDYRELAEKHKEHAREFQKEAIDALRDREKQYERAEYNADRLSATCRDLTAAREDRERAEKERNGANAKIREIMAERDKAWKDLEIAHDKK